MPEAQGFRKDIAYSIAKASIAFFLKEREAGALVVALACEGRDVMLERLRGDLASAISVVAEAWQNQCDTDDFVSFAAGHSQAHFAEQLGVIHQRVVFVSESLCSLQAEWRYLERHSALQESRERDILLHLSCSGQLDDRYEIFEQIDAGGQSKILKARCRESGDLRALKILSAQSRSALLSRFLVEGSVGKHHLHHERLVKIFDYGGFFEPERHRGTYYIACELLEGSTLQHWMQRNVYRAHSTDPHMRLFQQMVESLDYLHKQGFIHCDVNPYNFFVTTRDEIKLLDFGIIESIQEAQKLSASQAISASQSMGGPTYQAPEQVDSLYGKPTPQTDVYALGVTWFEVLTGRLPLHGSDSNVLGSQFVSAQAMPVRPRNATDVAIPLWLDSLIVRCMENDPLARPTLSEIGPVLSHLVAFEIDSLRMDSLVEELRQVGFDSEKKLQESITLIRSQFLQTLTPEEMRFVPMERLENAEELVVARVQEEIQNNHKHLQALLSRTEPWDPLLQTCPNLLCQADYERGKKECPSCHMSWSVTCGSSNHTSSYFATRCQTPNCNVAFDRTFKIREAFRKTLKVALEEERCAEAAIVFLILGEHLKQAGEAINYSTYYETSLIELAPDREALQHDIFHRMREEWRALVEEARRGFRDLHPQVRQSLLEEARLLCLEERFRDALTLLQKFPPNTEDEGFVALRDELHEWLTAASLQDAGRRLELLSQRLQRMEVHLKELIPVEEQPPEAITITGWLQGIYNPLENGKKSLKEVADPLQNAEERIQVAREQLAQLVTPMEEAHSPVRDVTEALEKQQNSIQQMERAHQNKQWSEGVEEKLNKVLAAVENSEKDLGRAAESFQGLRGDLTQVEKQVEAVESALEAAQTPFAAIQNALGDAERHFNVLDSSSKESHPKLEHIHKEREVLLLSCDEIAGVFEDIAYASPKQKRLWEQFSGLKVRLQNSASALRARKQQHQQLAGEASKLLEDMHSLKEEHQKENDRYKRCQEQLSSLQGEKFKAQESLEQGQHCLRKERDQVEEIRRARDSLWGQEMARRAKVLYTSLKWSGIGSVAGLFVAVLIGWLLLGSSPSLHKPGWLQSVIWGGGMGLVMMFSVVAVLGPQVFPKPGVMVVGGGLVGSGVGLLLHLAGFGMASSAIGVFFGAVIGWMFASNAAMLWYVRKLEPWQTLRKALEAGRFGVLLGVFAGASFGSYIGYARLWQASSSTWLFLLLSSISFFGLIGVLAGYFSAGGVWTEFKQIWNLER